MKKNKGFFYIAHLILLLLIVFILHWVDYVQNEGFSPTDEGVVQAQSYRIINGQIPHKDFISIRPVFSGVLHTIDFLLPFPLIESGRWMTVMEVFITAFIVSLIIRMIFFKNNNIKTQLLYLLPITVCIYILNTNVISLYPWTTIDALMFTLAGLFFFIKSLNQDGKFLYGMIFLSALFFSLAALCRQTFSFTLVIAFIYFIIYRKRYKYRLIKLIFILTAGCFPVFLYVLFMVSNGVMDLFINQMTGRSEFIQTAVIAFVKGFAKSYLWPIYLITAVFLIISRKIKSGYLRDKILNVLLALYYIATVLCSIAIFYTGIDKLYIVPFELFWINFFLLLLLIFNYKLKHKQILLIFALTIIAWISSISLGANAPMYATGLLFSSIISLYFMTQIISLRAFYLSLIPYMLILFIIFINGQRANNYRDLPGDQLNNNIGDIFIEFGNIKTNNNTYQYLKELHELIERFKKQYKIAVLPNNSFVYPVAKIKNPLLLDWPQPDEFAGNKTYFLKKLQDVIQKQRVCFIVDKYNSKKLAEKFELMNYNDPKYSYLMAIYNYCLRYNINSKYFTVWLTQPYNIKHGYYTSAR